MAPRGLVLLLTMSLLAARRPMKKARSGEAAGQWKEPAPLLARLGSQGGLEIVPQGPAGKREPRVARKSLASISCARAAENHHNCNRQSCSTIPRDPVADVMGPGLARAGDQSSWPRLYASARSSGERSKKFSTPPRSEASRMRSARSSGGRSQKFSLQFISNLLVCPGAEPGEGVRRPSRCRRALRSPCRWSRRLRLAQRTGRTGC